MNTKLMAAYGWGRGILGLLAILLVGMALASGFAGNLYTAFGLILLVLIADSFIHRRQTTQTAMHIQRDRLCDVVLFGVAPAFIAFAMLREVLPAGSPFERPAMAMCVLYTLAMLIVLGRAHRPAHR